MWSSQLSTKKCEDLVRSNLLLNWAVHIYFLHMKTVKFQGNYLVLFHINTTDIMSITNTFNESKRPPFYLKSHTGMVQLCGSILNTKRKKLAQCRAFSKMIETSILVPLVQNISQSGVCIHVSEKRKPQTDENWVCQQNSWVCEPS